MLNNIAISAVAANRVPSDRWKPSDMSFRSDAGKVFRSLVRDGRLENGQLVSVYDVARFRYGTKSSYHKRYITNWRSRLTLESMNRSDCGFLTLTYNPEHYPADGKPHREDVQKFMKRLRRTFDYHLGVKGRFKYFLVSEYGDKLHRLHYHAVFFGLEPTAHNTRIIESCWQKGFVTYKPLIVKHIRYCTKYMFKRYFYPDNFVSLKSNGIGKQAIMYIDPDNQYKKKQPTLVHDGFGHEVYLDRRLKQWLFDDDQIAKLNDRWREEQLSVGDDAQICYMVSPDGEDGFLFTPVPIALYRRTWHDLHDEENLERSNSLNTCLK